MSRVLICRPTTGPSPTGRSMRAGTGDNWHEGLVVPDQIFGAERVGLTIATVGGVLAIADEAGFTRDAPWQRSQGSGVPRLHREHP